MRTGKLGALEADLAVDLHFGEWRDRGIDQVWPPPGDSADLSPTVLVAGDERVACFDGRDVPTVVRTMWEAEQPWVGRLWEAGQDVGGPLRLAAFGDYPMTEVDPAIPFVDPAVPSRVFSVVLRDTIPLENDNGLISLPAAE